MISMDYKKLFSDVLLDIIDLDLDKINSEIKQPINPEHGDLSFPVFELSKKQKKIPNVLAEEISQKLSSKYFSFSSINGYINAKIKTSFLIKETIKEAIEKKENFGKINLDNNLYVIDTFNANPLKMLHIGHLRNIVTGDFVHNILKFVGADSKPISYGGDIGTHVVKWYWYYKKLPENEKIIPKKDVSKWFGNIYLKAGILFEEDKEKHKEEINQLQIEIMNNPSLQKEIKYLAIESQKAYNKIGEELSITIDSGFLESEAEIKFNEIREELFKKYKDLFIESEGAIVADLKDKELGYFIIIKNNGALLYGAKDISLLKLKQERYPSLKNFIYVIASEQDFYLKQLFKLFSIIYPDTNHYHVSHGLINTSEGKMKSREGGHFLYEDFRDEIFVNVKKKLIENGLLENEEIIKEISFGVMKFEMLKTNLNKNIVFDISQALDFQGDTSPYVQYSGVRAKSILRKVDFQDSFLNNLDYNYSFEKEEHLLALKINDFKEKVILAYNGYKSHILVNYTLELAHIFNKFYTTCPVLVEDEKIKNTRLFLIKSFLITLENALNILGIKIPEKM